MSACRYGSDCQFAHGEIERRPIPRHPKYKTQVKLIFSPLHTVLYSCLGLANNNCKSLKSQAWILQLLIKPEAILKSLSSYARRLSTLEGPLSSSCLLIRTSGFSAAIIFLQNLIVWIPSSDYVSCLRWLLHSSKHCLSLPAESLMASRLNWIWLKRASAFYFHYRTCNWDYSIQKTYVDCITSVKSLLVMQLCRNYATSGVCAYGAKCRFIHDVPGSPSDSQLLESLLKLVNGSGDNRPASQNSPSTQTQLSKIALAKVQSR